MRWANKRLALAFVLGLVVIGGSDGVVLDSPDRSGGVASRDVGRNLGALELATQRDAQGWAALAEAAPSPTPRSGNVGNTDSSNNGRMEARVRGRAPSRPSGDIAALISSYPWPAQQALAVAACEGGETSVGIYGHRGYFQIGEVHLGRIHRLGYTWDDMLVAGPNIAVALDLWDEQGWVPWRASRRCHGLY